MPMQKHPQDMEIVELYLSLGSNQGDRRLNIEHAISMLNIELKKPYKAISSILETEPWGFDSEEKFLNAAVLYELEMPKGYNAEAEALMILRYARASRGSSEGLELRSMMRKEEGYIRRGRSI